MRGLALAGLSLVNNLNTFGVIRSSAGDPRIMQFAVKYIF